MALKTLGILLYIDDTPSMLEDFSWIYKSWIHSGNWRTSDLIAVCHPSAYESLPADSGVVRIPREPVSQPGGAWENYRFINSIGCLVGDHTKDLAPRYTHFLRSDADVFLTRNLVNFRPNVAVHGRGHYAQSREVQTKMLDFAARHGLEHQGIFNCGHSLLAHSQDVLFFLQEQMTVCRMLLEEFRDDPGEWPGWCRDVLTMYAAELVANHYWQTYSAFALFSILDFESNLISDIEKTNVYHIHALHTHQYWSKEAYRQGLYEGYVISDLNRSVVSGYCHWIAATPVEDIKRLAGYPE